MLDKYTIFAISPIGYFLRPLFACCSLPFVSFYVSNDVIFVIDLFHIPNYAYIAYYLPLLHGYITSK